MSGLESVLIKAKSAVKRGDTDSARALYQQALDQFPRNKRLQAALRALDVPPAAGGNAAQHRLNAMVEAYKTGRMEEAAGIGAQLAEALPHNHTVHNLQGAALLALGDLAAAEAAFRRALAADPKAAASYNNLAIALKRQGKMADAEDTYRKVVSDNPDYADARYNLANLLEQSGRVDEAAEHYAQALRISPDYADAHYNLGNLKANRLLHEEALAHLEQAARLRPSHSDAHNNKGSALFALDRIDDALAAYDRALAADPANTQAMINKGKALVKKGDLPCAIASFRSALAVDPGDGGAHLYALFQEAHICDWSTRGEFARLPAGSMETVPPFAAFTFIDDPAHLRARAQAFAARSFAPEGLAMLPAPARPADGHIRIGYFSADFHDHATMYLLAGVLREHDRSRFAVHAYSYGPPRRDDAMREHLLSHVDGFTEIGEMTDEQVVALARRDNIDIAIDLKGFTRGSRSRMFGKRLAPVQVNYLGFPGTMGHPAFDYFIADHVSVPAGAEFHFSEKIVRLAGTYQPNDDQRAIVPDTLGRSGHGLPEDAFVFCSFNDTYKITPREFDIWMRLLGKVEGSVLWLFRTNQWAEGNLIREAEARGIGRARLVFAPWMPHGEHLGRLGLADLFLDSFAVNAHTTASDALWAGLPVLTMPGRQFVARVAASLVRAAGLPELAVGSEAEYEAMALDLARDPEKLRALRNRLAQGRTSAPLFRTADYTRRLESAFEAMHARRLQGLAPDHLDIA
jgi:predicted O-linked N-acetylglucosamine transferase (SPINDLY family)